jgi:guanylate kinase
MNAEKLEGEIVSQKPRLIYLSGKTCTGKTTFANYLERHGYSKVGLDKIVMDSVVAAFEVPEHEAFLTAYRDEGPSEHVAAFIAAAKLEIAAKLTKSSIVVEGAIATTRILRQIFSEDLSDFVFIYFHPVHLDIYVSRIHTRFIAGARDGTSGLPKRFWDGVREQDLQEFLEVGTVNTGLEKSIRDYAEASMLESTKRLAHLKSEFSEIIVVEV